MAVYLITENVWDGVANPNPLRSYRDPKTGQQIDTGGFLNAERKLLESRGWQYNSSTGAYHPPN